jgi:hypothetical protein
LPLKRQRLFSLLPERAAIPTNGTKSSGKQPRKKGASAGRRITFYKFKQAKT